MAFYTKAGVGTAPSSAPTINIERKGSGSAVVSGGTTTAGLNAGVYYYSLASGSDATADSYVAVFHTSDSTMDSQDVPALWVVGTNNVPADAKAVNAVSTSPVTTVSAFLGSTGAAVNGTNANTLASHDPGATIGTSTYAGGAVASVTGAVGSVTGNVGGNVVGSVGSVGAGGITSASFGTGATIPRVTLADTITTYTGNTPQTGDAYAYLGTNLGALGANATALAPAATALSTANWTATRAGKLDNLDAAVSSRSTFAAGGNVNVASFTAGAITTAAFTAGAVNSTVAPNLDAAVSSRSTFAGGAVASVTGAVGSIVGVTFPANFGTLVLTNGQAVGTSTYAGADTAGTTTLLSRITGAVPLASDWTPTRAGKLDNIDVAVSTRGTSTYAGGAVASVAGNVGGTVVGAPSWYAAPDNADIVTALGDLVMLLARTDPTAALAAVKTVTDALSARLPGSGTLAVAGDAMALTTAERSAVANALLDLANGVEASVTVRQALRLMAAMLGGLISGADTTNPIVKAAANSATTRLSATVDASGNRSAVSLSL